MLHTYIVRIQYYYVDIEFYLQPRLGLHHFIRLWLKIKIFSHNLFCDDPLLNSMNLVMASTASCTAVCCAIKCVGFSGFFSTWYAVHYIPSRKKQNFYLI